MKKLLYIISLVLLLSYTGTANAISVSKIIGGDIDITDGKCLPHPQINTENIDSLKGVGPSIYVKDCNTVYIAYYQNTTTYPVLSKTTDSGTTWTTVIISNNITKANITNHIVLVSPDSGSTLYVAYQQYIASPLTYNIILAKSVDSGDTWAESIVDTNNLYAFEGISLSTPVDTNKVLIFYKTYQSGLHPATFRSSSDGGTIWSITTTVSTQQTYIIRPHLMASIDGDTIYIPYWSRGYYCGDGSTLSQICIATSVNGGVNFSYQSSLGTIGITQVTSYLVNNNLLYFIGNGGNGTYFQKYDGSSLAQARVTLVATNRDSLSAYLNNVNIARHADSGSNLELMKSTDSGTSFTHIIIDPNFYHEPSLFTIKNNYFFIVYQELPGNQLKFAHQECKCGI